MEQSVWYKPQPIEKFEDKLVKKAKEEIKKKKDSETESTSQKRRKRRLKVFECPEDCNAFCPDEKRKFCGYSRYRDKAHDLKDCRCKKHFNVKENFNEFSTSKSSWETKSNFKVPVEPKIEVQKKQGEEQQEGKTWTPQAVKALKDEYERYQEWEKREAQRKDQRSPESTSSEQTKRFESKRRNRKDHVKIKVVRLNTEIPKEKRKEIVLIPAPRVLAEREGRPLPVEVTDDEERLEGRPIEGPIVHEVTVAGRYAVDNEEHLIERLAEAEAKND
jgi:hypothetical protein